MAIDVPSDQTWPAAISAIRHYAENIAGESPAIINEIMPQRNDHRRVHRHTPMADALINHKCESLC